MNSNESNKEIEFFPVVEDFYSIQGEGFHTGKPAYFIRIGGCNVCCGFCDVKESWNPHIHQKFSIESIIAKIKQHPAKSIVITGGEPLMNNLTNLCKAIKDENIETFLETSGTHTFSGIWDWVCLSPKKHHAPLSENYNFANELKVVIDKKLDFEWAELCKTKVPNNCLLYLQPEWNSYESVIPEIISYIKEHPEWRISIQTHKFLNIP